MELLDELGSFITRGDVAPERWPWLLNTRAMALSGLGRYEAADAAYVEMQELAQALPPSEVAQDLISTALQNRGVVAVETDNSERAIALLRAALPAKVELGDWISAIDVLTSLSLAIADGGDLEEAERMLSSVEVLARQLDEPRRLGAAYGNRGVLRARRGDFVGAERDARIALRYARADRDPFRELLGIMNIGSALADRGRYGQALRWYRRGVRRASDGGIVVVEIRLRRGVALMLLRTNRWTEAANELEHALELAEGVGHMRHAAECRADLGALYTELGALDRAEAALKVARREFVALGDPHWEAQVVRNLAELAVRRDQLRLADELWQAAVPLLDDEPELAAGVARRAAEAWIADGEAEIAHRWLTIELDRATRFQSGASLAWRTATAGALLNWRHGTELGLGLLDAALRLYEEVDDRQQAARVRLDRAAALSDLGRHNDAIEELETCLYLADERSDRVLRQHVLASLGEVVRRRGDLDRSLEHLQDALRLARELGDEPAVAHALGNVGLAQIESGELDAAYEAFSEQLRLARQLGTDPDEAAALGGLGNLDFIARRFSRAAARYQQAAHLSAGGDAVAELENLGAWLESSAAAGDLDDLQEIAQRLVDAAQRAGLHEKAPEPLARTGRVLLKAGEWEGAASLYSAATRVYLTQAIYSADFEARVPEILAETFGLMTAHVEVDLDEHERESFYEAVLAQLEVDSGLGEQLRPYLEQVRSALEQQGVFRRLRETEQPDDQTD